ncbi:CapA family protein [Jiangella rhizosphaerae]|uniref:CapA family protein n=1 Tax=Jiangella rhizosphaerae TaxID=2293569 RepID=A0A418KMY0_9ACTN|nr:CapA family protein [Jiangella rhizosphaerae]RIQ20315.1 CapA family protein [Jiangella rhizosphaerae]
MHRRGVVAAALAVAVLVTGCASGSGGDGLPAADSPPAGPTPSPSPTPSPTPTPTPTPDPVTLAFAGDIHFEGALRARLDDPATALAPVAAQLGAADLTVVNLETSVGNSGTPEPGKRFTFQAPPTALTALQAAGVDVVTMANNHAMDFGPDGLADTLAARTSAPGLDVVGVGADLAEAFAPAIRDVGGTAVAVIGANVPDDPGADPTAHWAATGTTAGVATALDPAPLLDAIARARTQAGADVVVVYLHWGVQGESCPSPSQTALAATLAGHADVVVGSHTHRLQGTGLAPATDTYVAYGLGNFVWYTQGSAATSTTGLLTLTVEDGTVTAESWAPARIGADGLPVFATGDAAGAMTAGRAALRECTDLRPLP